ncbi:inorganic triphosphatase [Vibrio sp. S4M6]|uniref:CYTH and CHAD domain-containing protein n=1 Tax=Vibrio sinus TaxID=2946865 RepID=UPI002029D610|nr:inorganic triphosphatase [Vibrio sinus]MCL9781505.1 inorganic triphosphatase [Vibrio sinus]
METEIELKFLVSADFSQYLRKTISQKKVLQHSSKVLENTYFDTPEHWLRQHDIGLRIRRFDDVYVQTVKTAGRVVAGLHQRPEYNAEHINNTPDLSLHPEDIWPDDTNIDEVQSKLIPLFTTNFTREQWLIAMDDGSQIEVAFDQGEVVSGNRQVPICEVELELRSGQTDALFSLARVICEPGGVRLGNVSKAAKGYRLALNASCNKVKPLAIVQTREEDSIEKCFIHSLEHALKHWQYHEQIYVEQPQIDALLQIRHSVSFILQILSTFASVVPRKASAILRQELKWMEQEFVWLDDSTHLQGLMAEKGHALRKLDARKPILKALNSKYQTLPSHEDMLALICSARYTELLLDVSRWVLTRGWRPFLDDKSESEMSSNVHYFSVRQLDRAWGELSEMFTPELSLSRQDYIEQRPLLKRNLYTGISFANLFDVEERDQYRLPWADLLQGIEDLLMLEPMQEQLSKLQGEEKEQLNRWLSRKENSILHAMEQTRQICLEAIRYWQH